LDLKTDRLNEKTIERRIRGFALDDNEKEECSFALPQVGEYAANWLTR